MSKKRIERDSMGEVEVPVDRLWGAQTQRSLTYFNISEEKMDRNIIVSLLLIKKAAAIVNSKNNKLNLEKSSAIQAAIDELLNNLPMEEFPLSIWQTGSGTQTNMNVNEVVANLAQELSPGLIIHPNDDVNQSQSSNDVFASAINIAAMMSLNKLIPELMALHFSLNNKAQQFDHIIKIGRTHLMDAVPLSLGQEFSGYAMQIEKSIKHIEETFCHLKELAIGGTAVGTGLNAPEGFSDQMVRLISQFTGIDFYPAVNNFEALAANDSLVQAHGALKGLAASLFKISNDIRWLASGPRSGLGEISIPANEPGSSIMPGKVNPTQSEALCMICAQVMGNDVAISFGGSLGNFELNVFKPLIIYNFLQTTRLLRDGVACFNNFCVKGIVPNEVRIAELVNQSLMLVTTLSPYLGYEKTAQIANKAYKENKTLKMSALELGLISEKEFDFLVDPKNMVKRNKNEKK